MLVSPEEAASPEEARAVVAVNAIVHNVRIFFFMLNIRVERMVRKRLVIYAYDGLVTRKKQWRWPASRPFSLWRIRRLKPVLQT
jgi:hypothetical protein